MVAVTMTYPAKATELCTSCAAWITFLEEVLLSIEFYNVLVSVTRQRLIFNG